MSLVRRRELLTALAAGHFIASRSVWAADSPNIALTLARLLNATRFSDLPATAIERARMIIASTLASAASGSLISSARIVRDLAKEQGGKSEATIWFDGAKLPVSGAARVNAT